MVQRTTKSGSPLPSYLTQKPRQSPITPISKTQFQILQSGIRYAYSGLFGSGAAAAVSVTLLDIGNSGDKDLWIKMLYGGDFDSIDSEAYFGFNVAINGTTIMNTKAEVYSQRESVFGPATKLEFILPAHSALVVLGISETTNIDRWASLIGSPL
tara:strand:- start:39 stop:503 length:465 start_codon:yes stop_codon:yes gene_type:complete